MAKFSNRAALVFNFALLATLLLTVNIVEGRLSLMSKMPLKPRAPVCATVYGAEAGDTCYSITQFFGISMDFFAKLNPNLVCEHMFVGEWVCITGST